jgi:putative ATP-binding cassette transporter
MKQFLQMVQFLFRMSRQLKYPRALVALLIVAGIVAGVASSALVAVISAWLSDRFADRSLALGIFVALCLLLPVSRFLSQYLLVRLAQQITFDLRIRLCRSIVDAPLRQLESIGGARLLASLTDDITTVTSALTIVPVLFLHFSVVLTCLIYMGWLSWSLLLLVLGAVVLGFLTYQLPLLAALRHFEISRKGWDKMFRAFRGVIDGTKELKIHRGRREAFMKENLEETAAMLRHHNVIGNAIYAVVSSWGQVLFFVVIGVILFAVPQFMSVSPATTSAYIMAILFMLTPIDVIMNSLPGVGRAAVAIRTIESLGLSIERAADAPEVRSLPGWRKIALVGARHRYLSDEEDETFNLGPLHLALVPGEIVFIVGGNGSGKTTLAKMLIGLYECEQGHIELDGREVTPERRETYRELFSVVFSDYFLFDTLFGLGGGGADGDAASYLAKLRLSHKVKVENGAFSTIDLSQGQRKRLALMVALMENRSIYLFDEWAADQDPRFKELFYFVFLPELKARGKTVVVISHDDHYFDVADRIIRLEDGQIEFDGPTESYFAARAEGFLEREGAAVGE